jgi:uncharacterized membrane protein
MEKPHSRQTDWLQVLIVVLLVLGVFFRFANLGYKVYWHDEVYTSIRAAGFTREEIDRELFQNRIIPVKELQKFQRLKPGSSVIDTIRSLGREDPQHPPLYFLMARFWMQLFGSSLTASRSLPALLSLLGLPLMYWLGLELFGSRLVAILATTLLALSPVDVLFAQTARQYSLLTVIAIGNSVLLLRALRLQSWQNWLFYSLGSIVGLSTHTIFGLTLISHGIYVLLLSVFSGSRKQETPKLVGLWRQSYQFRMYLIAVAGAVVLYSPWLFVIKKHYQSFSASTSWINTYTGLLYLVKKWILNLTCSLLDLTFGFNSVWTYLLRLPVVMLIAVAIYLVCRQTTRATWLFILTTIFVPFLILALPDVLFGGQRSATTRFLIACYPGIHLAIAHLLANKLLVGRWFWRGVVVLLLTGTIASCTLNTFSDTGWSKGISYANAEVARVINRERMNTVPIKPPLILSDIGDFTNTGDLISLSYLLHEHVQFLLLSQLPNLELLQGYSTSFAFRPSKQLCLALEQKQIRLEQAFREGPLWRLRPKGSERSPTNQLLKCF